MRIDPNGEVRAALHVAAFGQIAVGEQRRVGGFIGLDADRVARHDVWAVERIGDCAEPLGFALRAEAAARHVEAFEMRVRRRRNARDDVEAERRGRIVDYEPARLDVVLIGGQILSVDRNTLQLEPFAVENQGDVLDAAATNVTAGGDQGRLRFQ